MQIKVAVILDHEITLSARKKVIVLYDNNNRIDRSNSTIEGTNTDNGVGKT
jgi:hypothetical protein